ncbi:hypothetical protein AYI68_g1737, partial [Smittium mucronatum]
HLKSLNLARLFPLLLQSISLSQSPSPFRPSLNSLLLSPRPATFQSVAETENILLKTPQTINVGDKKNPVRLIVSPDLESALASSSPNTSSTNINIFDAFNTTNENYYILVIPNPRSADVCLWFSESATTSDKFKGMYNSFSLARLISASRNSNNLYTGEINQGIKPLIDQSYEFTKSTFSFFYENLVKTGWHVDSCQFDNNKNRIKLERS